MMAKRAKAGYTEQHVIQTTYNIIVDTGIFQDACKEWRRRDEEDQTWAEFKLHFATAHQEMRESQETAQSAGYHGANNVQQDDSHMEAYANFAAADRNSNAQLTSTISTLTAALTEALKANKEIQTDMAAMKQQMLQLTNQQRNRQQQGQGNSHSNKSSNNKRSNNAVTERKWFNKNYCWSHGYHVHNEHTSETCKYPKYNHQKDATRDNNKGGSQTNKELAT
jgi:hypothetical protein